MQENNFEKQVQEKMGDFRVDPSSEIWQKVSLQIGRRKRDDRVFIIFLLCLLFLGISGIIWWNVSTKKANTTETAQQSTQPLNNLKDAEKEGSVSAPELSQADVTKNKNADAAIEKEIIARKGDQPLPANSSTTARVEKISPTISIITNKTFISPTTKRKYTQSSKTIAKSEAGIADEDVDPSALIELKDVAATKNNEEQVLENEEESISLLDADQRQVVQSPLLETSEHLKTAGAEIQQQTFSNNIPLNKKNARWSFGINFSAGISTTRSGYLGIVAINSDEDKALYSSPANSNTGSQSPGNSYSASAIKRNIGFVAGAFAKRNLTPRTSLVIGLNYKYYSTSMTIGNRVDSFSNVLDLSFYYRSGNQFRYTNRYHFVEIPIGLQWRVTGPQKWPVYLYTGIDISKLVSSNALQLDNASYFYYKDNSVFTKTQFDLSVKLLFGVSKNRRSDFLIGPELNFGLTKMASSGFYQGRHYSYLGIHLQKGILKK